MTNTMNLLALPFGKISTRLLLLLGLFVVGISCITVNVYFPEGAVQRAADDFVRDLYKSEKPPAPKAAPSTDASKPSIHKTSMSFSLIESAHAADEITVSTPKAQEIKQRMAGRVHEISIHKAKGHLGEGNDGMLVVKDASKANLKERAALERLISTENKDRESLYDEVQSANKLNDRNQVKIRAHFSRAFQEHSPAGTWVQGESGGWTHK